ncbi:MAG: 6-phosphofructokinase [Flavobacteriales bacterium]
MKEIKNIGVFTSGGDSPGMNACIRAIARTASYHGIKVTGIMRGLQGLIDADFVELPSSAVSNIVQRGGTILKTARSQVFRTTEGRKKAFENIQKHQIDAIVAIGGDGTFKGLSVFNEEHDVISVGVPGTIDNDLYGTDYTIGFDTAINTIVSAVDKIRDTASSHDRLFVIEVMGNDSGFLALHSGIGVGAEAILVPEEKTRIPKLIKKLKEDLRASKTSSIVIVAEGDDAGGAYEVSMQVQDKLPHFDVKVSVLGHLQRGGAPTAYDRLLASRLGSAAVEALLAGKTSVMTGLINNEVVFTPYDQTWGVKLKPDPSLIRLAEILSV